MKLCHYHLTHNIFHVNMRRFFFGLVYLPKVYFDQLLGSQILLLLFLHSLLLCHILLFGCWIFSIPSKCQKVWIQIRPDILSGLIWVQTFAKVIGRQQKSPLADKELKQLVGTTLAKVISFGSNFSHLAQVLATTNSQPGKALLRNL